MARCSASHDVPGCPVRRAAHACFPWLSSAARRTRCVIRKALATMSVDEGRQGSACILEDVREAHQQLVTRQGLRCLLALLIGQTLYVAYYCLRRPVFDSNSNNIPVAAMAASFLVHLFGLTSLLFEQGRRRDMCFQYSQTFALIVDAVLAALSNVGSQPYLPRYVPEIEGLLGKTYPCRWVEIEEGITFCGAEGQEALRGDMLFLLQVLIISLTMLRSKPATIAASVSLAIFQAIRLAITGSAATHQDVLQGWLERALMVVAFSVVLLACKQRLQSLQLCLMLELALKDKEVIQEKVLRCRAEFLLSQSSSEQQNNGTADAQMTSATNSEHFFRMLADSSQGGNEPMEAEPDLGSILQIGRKEHWLVSSSEIHISEHRLGQGGFGVVFKGSSCGVPVAVKISKRTCVGESMGEGCSKFMRALVNELRVLRHVRHPYIVSLHGAVIDAESVGLGIVMEYIPGQTLKRFVRQSTRFNGSSVLIDASDSLCLQLIKRIASGMWYLHSRHPEIIHGDVKPDNILIEGVSIVNPCPKIIDFGLCSVRALQGNPLGGTTRWSAPEVIFGRPVTVAADTFSFAYVAYFVATGSKPLDGFNDDEILRWKKTQTGIPNWPNTGFALRCQSVLNDCMRLDAAQRPGMNSVYENLRSWLSESSGLESSTASQAKKVAKPSGKHHILIELHLLELLGELRDNPSLQGDIPSACCREHGLLVSLITAMEALLKSKCSVLRKCGLRHGLARSCPCCVGGGTIQTMPEATQELYASPMKLAL